MFLTHQYLEQIDERIRNAVFGNVGTMISFSVGAQDAKYLVREFSLQISELDFINMPKYAFYLKLMIYGATSNHLVLLRIHYQKSSIHTKNK